MTNPNKLKGSNRETTTSPTSLSRRRKERKQKRGNSESADWISADSSKVLALIGLVSANRGTVTFGYTRDGGAFYLSYYYEGEAEKIFIRPTEDIDIRLDEEIESWNI